MWQGIGLTFQHLDLVPEFAYSLPQSKAPLPQWGLLRFRAQSNRKSKTIKLIKGNSMARRGGKRPNAGRKAGSVVRGTIENRDAIGELARAHTEVALQALV